MSDHITRWNAQKHLRYKRIATLQQHLSRESQGKHLGHVIIIGNAADKFTTKVQWKNL
uniref:Uncharacterized protein n=1 Tax=viral metagenome TaxID=1070528 RepID=A0A6C0CLE2_9ZZZZ